MSIYNETEHAKSMLIQGLKHHDLFSPKLTNLTTDQIDKCREIFLRKETHLVEHNDPNEYELKGNN